VTLGAVVAGRWSAVRQHQVARFLSVGVANTLIDIVIYTCLALAGVPILLANFISTSAGMTFSFAANSRFTFRTRPSSRRALLRQVVSFLVVTGVGLWALQPLVIIAVTPLIETVTSTTSVILVASKLAGIVVGLVWNYVGYRLVVFAPGGTTAVTLEE